MMRRHDYEIAPNAFYGHTVLTELPPTFGRNPLPHLVREAVQNSLDAWDGQSDQVAMTFRLHRIGGQCLATTFQDAIFPDNDYLVLEISDEGTTGLDGSIERPAEFEDMGRFWRFALSMGVNQSCEGAGGVWGIGKSILFQAGIGFVIIESLIGGGERRLCAKWIVDERNSNRRYLLDCSTGISFWGDSPERPMTSTEGIESVFRNLQIPVRSKIGTSLYIALDPDATRYLGSCDDYREDTISQRILVALSTEVYRWYFPRQGPNFRVPLILKVPQIDPGLLVRNIVIDRLSTLYEAAFSTIHRASGQHESAVMSDAEVHLLMPLRGHGGEAPIGAVVWKDFGREELGMAAPSNGPAPGTVLTSEQYEDERRSFCAIVRGAGMVVWYDRSLLPPPDKEDTYRLGVVAINPAASVMRPKTKADLMSAEEYFRGCESKDHTGWDDKEWKRNSRERTNHASDLFKSIRKLFSQTPSAYDNNGERDVRMGRLAGEFILAGHSFGSGGHVAAPADFRVEGRTSMGGRNAGWHISKLVDYVVARGSQMGETNLDIIAILNSNIPLMITCIVRAGRDRISRHTWREEIGSEAPWRFDILGDLPPEVESQQIEDGFVLAAKNDVQITFKAQVKSTDPNLKFELDGRAQK